MAVCLNKHNISRFVIVFLTRCSNIYLENKQVIAYFSGHSSPHWQMGKDGGSFKMNIPHSEHGEKATSFQLETDAWVINQNVK
jgi:hypothetical protein